MKKSKKPAPPARFWGRQLTFWDELYRLLIEEGIMDDRDYWTSVSLVDLWSEYDKAQEILKEDGLFYDTGLMKRPHPAIDVVNRCRRDLVTYIDHFGLSPKSRSKMTQVFKDGEPKTELEKMIEG